MKRQLIILLAAILLLPVGLSAANSIEDIEITVLIRPDGSALVTQKWVAYADQGTEAYIPVTNLGKMDITSFYVSEDGVEYANEGLRWDVDRSRSAKKGRCGMIRTSSGYELCWGIGEYGDHAWRISYELTGLVQAMEDYDGFNFMFVNRDLNPRPEHAKIIISPGKDMEGWTSDNCKIWGFGYDGDIYVKDGSIVAETYSRISSGGSMIVLARFDKGLMSPEIQRSGTFAQMQEKAFEDSEYKDDDGKTLGLMTLAFLLTGGGILIWMIIAKARGYKYAKKTFGTRKITGWWRDVPLGGNLPASYYILSRSGRFSVPDYTKELIGAYFLRWILEGKVKVQPDQSSSKRVNLSFAEYASFDEGVEKDLYDMARSASGSNLILEKNEFEKWSAKNFKKVTIWPDRVKSFGREFIHGKGMFALGQNLTEAGQEEARHLIEMRNFLKDFTLSDQREASEVGLWKDYLVFAQLFGIADKVAEQFKKLYPEQFGQFAQTSGLDMTNMLNTINMTRNISANAMTRAMASKINAQARSGGGGRVSWGGGGGFSGGGFGGGFR